MSTPSAALWPRTYKTCLFLIRIPSLSSFGCRRFPPQWLAVRWLQELGPDAAWARAEAANRQPPLTIRVNTALISRENLAIVLEAEGVVTEPCRYSPFGLNLQELQQSPFSLPSYLKGRWLFQDEAAQLVTMLLQPEPGQQILEIGAGRGGKTTHRAQALDGQGEIVAVDNHRTRIGGPPT